MLHPCYTPATPLLHPRIARHSFARMTLSSRDQLTKALRALALRKRPSSSVAAPRSPLPLSFTPPPPLPLEQKQQQQLPQPPPAMAPSNSSGSLPPSDATPEVEEAEAAVEVEEPLDLDLDLVDEIDSASSSGVFTASEGSVDGGDRGDRDGIGAATAREEGVWVLGGDGSGGDDGGRGGGDGGAAAAIAAVATPFGSGSPLRDRYTHRDRYTGSDRYTHRDRYTVPTAARTPQRGGGGGGAGGGPPDRLTLRRRMNASYLFSHLSDLACIRIAKAAIGQPDDGDEGCDMNGGESQGVDELIGQAALSGINPNPTPNLTPTPTLTPTPAPTPTPTPTPQPQPQP